MYEKFREKEEKANGETDERNTEASQGDLKLISLGITDEEKVKKLTPNGLLKSENISFEEVLLIYELQESVKKNRVFSFLAKKDD